MNERMELASLCSKLGCSAKSLYSLSNRIEKQYVKVKIPKKTGGFRELTVPNQWLKSVQNRIYKNLLKGEEVSKYATAYVPGGGISKNANPHVGQKKLLKLDIKGFFDNVIYSRVKDLAFPKDKYAENVRVLLAILCTYDQHLPQGAPTSPIISNLIMKDFDETVGCWCELRGINYTRYCDDMSFSGDFDENEVTVLVKKELRKLGFFLNKKKTICVCEGQQQAVTGVVVNEKANVASEYRKRIRQEMYYIRKYGVAEHISRSGIEASEEKTLHRLLGQVNFVLSINKSSEFEGYRNELVLMVKGR